jgi:hypothetical protein
MKTDKMKTTLFFSYKSGAGRSLTAANYAVFLSRLGKHCAILDFDFDAPSLHHKFPNCEGATGTGGFAQCFFSDLGAQYETARTSEGNVRPQIAHFDSPLLSPSLSKKTDLPAYSRRLRLSLLQKSFAGALDEENEAEIHLIPAGDIWSTEYWDTVTKYETRALLSLFREEARGCLSKRAFVEACVIFQRIKDRIANLDPKPEYLIVDLRSGVLDQAIALTALWAESVVFFLTSNKETFDYANAFIPFLKRIREYYSRITSYFHDVNNNGDNIVKERIGALLLKTCLFFIVIEI